ncbi:MAG TPA: DUF5677 domain-containing protein [Nitrospiraceae bacterium]|nr:DUF5677 domain-containing protein [Nitrospiraceae bacterium]
MDIDDLYGRFGNVVSKIEESITSLEKNLYKVLVLYFFGKSYKTFRSIHLLCKHCFTEDAGILARSLFDLVVTLLYMSKASDERALLYAEFGVILKERLHETLAKEPEDPWRQKILASKSPEARAKDRAEYERIRKKYSDKYKWSGLSIKDMAEEVGLSWHYDFVYYQLSELAHTGPNGVTDFMHFDDQNGLSFKNSSMKDIERIWTTTSVYFLFVLDEVNDIFKLGLEEEIKRISKDLKGLKKENS